nr:MAG TPA: hypothetical protein [Caudoviricetes sp.]
MVSFWISWRAVRKFVSNRSSPASPSSTLTTLKEVRTFG